MIIHKECKKLRKGSYWLGIDIFLDTDNEDIYGKPSYIFSVDVYLFRYNLYVEFQFGEDESSRELRDKYK